jgi:hypothetical protein
LVGLKNHLFMYPSAIWCLSSCGSLAKWLMDAGGRDHMRPALLHPNQDPMQKRI